MDEEDRPVFPFKGTMNHLGSCEGVGSNSNLPEAGAGDSAFLKGSQVMLRCWSTDRTCPSERTGKRGRGPFPAAETTLLGWQEQRSPDHPEAGALVPPLSLV